MTKFKVTCITEDAATSLEVDHAEVPATAFRIANNLSFGGIVVEPVEED